jgi:hypothetical protein
VVLRRVEDGSIRRWASDEDLRACIASFTMLYRFSTAPRDDRGSDVLSLNRISINACLTPQAKRGLSMTRRLE